MFMVQMEQDAVRKLIAVEQSSDLETRPNHRPPRRSHNVRCESLLSGKVWRCWKGAYDVRAINGWPFMQRHGFPPPISLLFNAHSKLIS
mmetsp:Transcript_10203/g.37928  ORF Transcript_10203/g.37928 Transcript_10203/m.37928 type:complete len:89 (+) Transcript_10203:9-275(+)